jgi:tetratricopeptide (TPR) repeat protein
MSKHKQKTKEGKRGGGVQKMSGAAAVGDAGVGISKKKTALLLGVILVLAAITFSNSFQNGFTNWDDDRNVYENKYIAEISLQNLKVYFTKPLVAMYTPLVYLSYAVDYQRTQLDPTGYHATNLLLHLINASLVFFVIFLLTERLEAAAIVALIFAVHPLNAAAVTPVSIRSSLLYTMFYLGALIAYVKYAKKGLYEGKYLLGAGILFILALLSKSAAVVFPFLMLLTDHYYGRKIDKRTVVEKVPFFALSLFFGILTFIFREDARHLGSSYSFDLIDRVFLTSYSILFYAVKLVHPVNLSAYYPYPAKTGDWLPIEFYLALPALLVTVWALFRVKKSRKLIVFGSLFYLINIMLVLKIIPMGNEMVCDRYAYLPTVGLLMTLVCVFYQAKDNGLRGRPNVVRAAGVLLAAYVLLFSWMSYGRNPVWKDSVSLHSDSIRKYHNVPTAYNGRGLAYWQQKAYKDALADFDQAIFLESLGSDYYSNRGNVKVSMGDYEGALHDFDKAIALNNRAADGKDSSREGRDPDTALRLAAAYNNRGELKKTLQDYDAALLDYGKAIEADPEYSIAYNGRAAVHVIREDFDGALKDYNKAIELDPYRGGSVYYRRAYIHMIKENFTAALKDYTKAIEFSPGNVDALNNRGYIRHLLNDNAGAIEDYTNAILLAPAQHDAFHNRGLIKWLQNDKTGACSDWKKAAQLGRKDSREAVVSYCRD